MKKPGAVLVFLFILIGLVLTGVAGYLSWSRSQFSQSAVETKGVVVEMRPMKQTRKSKRKNRTPAQAPSIRYTTADGRELVHHSNTGQHPPAYEVGEEVMIYYDPQNPEDVLIKGDNIVIYILGGVGLSFLLISGTLVARRLRG